MQTRVLPATISIFVLFFCTDLHSANLSPINWQECVELAAKNNPDLTSATKAAEAAKANYYGSFNGLFPSLSLSSGYSESDTRTVNNWNAQADASIDLLNLNNNAQIKSAKASFEQATANARVSSADVRYLLRNAYANLLFSQELVVVSEKIQNLRRDNSQTVSLKYESGRESKGNMLRAEAESIEADAELASAKRNLRSAQREMDRQLGNDTFTQVVATGTLNTPNMASSEPDYDHILINHPRLLVEEANLKGSLSDLASARSSLWPTLSGSYTRSLIGEDFFPDEPHWSLAGVVRLPIFGAGPTATYYAVKTAQRRIDQAKADMRSTRYTLQTDLETTWANLGNTIDQVSVQDHFLEAARQRNDEAMIRYSSGLMSFEDWELAVADLVNFERSAIRSQLNAVLAETAWDRAIGKQLEE